MKSRSSRALNPSRVLAIAALVTVACGLMSPGARALDVFVKTPANGGNDANDGLSWATAKATVSGAFSVVSFSNNLDTIRVAAGTYNEKPQFPQRRRKELLGGFPAAGGSNVSDPIANPTIIDGTGLGTTNRALITIPAPSPSSPTFGTSEGLVIDGFILRNGSGSFAGAINSQSLGLRVSKNVIENNTGSGVGAIHLFGTLQDFAGSPEAPSFPGPRIERNIIRYNLATMSGIGATGGINLTGAFGRDGTTNNGGALNLTFYNTQVVNNLIYANVSNDATGGRGGMRVEYAAHADVVNCTIAYNTGAVAGLFASGASASFRGEAYLKNTIVWHPGGDDLGRDPVTGLITASFCDLNDAADVGLGGNNLSLPPAFTDAPGTTGAPGAGGNIGSADYTVTDCSPCFNMATATGAPSIDLVGTSRPQLGGFDMGAYERAIVADADTDGVPDCSDACPGTPAGQPVNAQGCSCSQSDSQPPVLAGCPQNMTLPAEAGVCSAVATWTPPTASDNCHVMSLTASHDPGDVFPAGTTQVTYTATDDLGNTAICSFLVQVMDAQPPAWSGCPGNVSVTAPPGACSAEVNWTSPTASDNCGIDSQSSSHSPGGAFPVGVTPVSYIATDTAGNMSTCSFDVTILDEEDPVIASCPGNMSVFTSPGNPGAAVTWMQPTASDNCAGVALSASHVPGASFPVGTTSVSFTATDAGGRMASCGFSVTVVDGEAPTLTGCPMNIAVAADAGQCTASVGWTEPTAADNVGLTGMTSTHSPGASFPIGTTNVTYVATDVHGNAAQCVFSITVTDHEGPAFVACEPTRTAQADSMCRSVVPDLAGSAVVTDNCDSTAGVHQSPAAGTVVGLGSTPVTLTATDANGNTRTCVVMFAVVPNGCDTPDEPGPTPGPGPAPTDVDGVDSSIEDAAPNSGDGNGDGVPDSAQDHVSSLIDARGLYVTLAAPAGTQLAGVFVGGNPSPDTSPDGAEFPVGFLNFSVLGVTPGGMVDVQVILHGPTDQPLDVYWKHGPTPGQASPHWYLFDHDGETGAIIRGDVITLKLRDGGRGDSDLQADGVIVDPGAPAIGGPESGPAPPGEPANDLCDNPLISALLPVRICGLGCAGALLGTIAGMAAMRRTGRRRSLR